MTEIQARDNSATAEAVRRIKQRFRLFMNGAASRSMRDKGLAYKVNWGIALPQLREMAADCGKDRDLALALWQEPVRECRIMATMIMPAGQMTEPLAEAWMSGAGTTELAELCAFNIFRHTSFAGSMSQRWLASGDKMRRLCAYHILSRLMQGGAPLGEKASREFLRRVGSDLKDPDMTLRHAAANCLTRFCDTDAEHARQAKDALKETSAGFFVEE